MVYLESPGLPSDKRIYVVIPNRVQAPLNYEEVTVRGELYTRLLSTEDTKTIQQPSGRALTQAAHVVSRVRDIMLKESLRVTINTLINTPTTLLAGRLSHSFLTSRLLDTYCEPYTTISLRVRDSYELNHVFHLLKFAGIKVHDFHDFNQPDYGSVDYRVRTAIATEPIHAEDVLGILDYLPLWKPEDI